MNTKKPVFTALLLLVALFVTACSPGDIPPATTTPVPPSGGPVANAGPDQGNIAPNTLITLNGNVPPVAKAGPDQLAGPGLVTLDGSRSSDVNGDRLTYSWRLTSTPVGSAAVLANATSVAPTFTADLAGVYFAQLIVNDGTVNSTPDTVMVTPGNVKPVANAGPDQLAGLGLVTLDGSRSSDVNGDPLTYSWNLTSTPVGSAAVLANATSVAPTFTTDLAGMYIAQLIVHDGTMPSAPNTVIISAVNVAPVAKAGPDQFALAGTLVTLNGNRSSDVNGDLLTYSWSLITKPAGSAAVLAGAGVNNASPTATFTADRDGGYIAQLIVHDGTVNSPPDTVTITAEPMTAEMVYTNRCAGCHRLGTFDTTGAPDLSKKGLKVQGKFRDSLGNPIPHNGQSLTDNEILDLSVFFNAN